MHGSRIASLALALSAASLAACATTTPPAPLTAPRAPDTAPPVAAIDTRPPAPEEAPAEPPPPEVAPPEGDAAPEVAPPPAGPTSILLIGDSKIATDFGAALQAELAARPELRVSRRGKSATGLARPDFFDWTREAERLIAERKPDVVIVGLGGNDGQALASLRGAGAGPARAVPWNTDAWAAAYGARVTAFLELLAAEGRRVVWLEVTTADRPRLETKLRTIRAVQREAIAAFGPRARYVETHAHLYDEAGQIVRQVQVDRRSQPLRIEDGIHFSVPGSRWLAARVAPDLVEALAPP